MLLMEDEKFEKLSISMPVSVLSAMERHIATIPSANRSSWLTTVAVKELEAAGAMGESEEDARFWAKARAAVQKDKTLKARIAKLLPESARRQLVPA